jgi:hypothetical protein
MQLIRGTDSDTPPTPEARPAGRELRRRLQMFRWKNYWEIKRQTVVIPSGGKSRCRMTSERDVEIGLPDKREMVVCIYLNGKLTRRRTQAIETAFYITGGDTDSDAAQSWFIVVRRDQPPGPGAN